MNGTTFRRSNYQIVSEMASNYKYQEAIKAKIRVVDGVLEKITKEECVLFPENLFKFINWNENAFIAYFEEISLPSLDMDTHEILTSTPTLLTPILNKIKNQLEATLEKTSQNITTLQQELLSTIV